MAKSYRTHYRNKEEDFFVKKRFDFNGFCNSRFSTPNENMLVRIHNAMTSALNGSPKAARLPNYVIIVLDDDLITYLDFKESGVATLLGTWIEWLAKQFNTLVSSRGEQLPEKCNKKVFFYWVSAPTHSCFSRGRNDLRTKYNLSLDSVVRSQDNMRLIKIKDWNAKDTTLVVNDKITETGMSAYWRAVDSSIHFNIIKRETFLAKQVSKKSESESQTKPKDDKPGPPLKDNMMDFFRRHHKHDHDRRMDDREDFYRCSNSHRGSWDNRRHFDKFLLPRPRYYYH